MRNKVIIAVLSIIVLTASFLAGWSLNSYNRNVATQKATEVAGIYIDDIISGKTSDAYKLASAQLKKDVNLEQFNKLAATEVNKDPNYISAYTATANNNFIVYSMVDGFPADANGITSRLFTVLVVKEGGQLKIDSAIVQ